MKTLIINAYPGETGLSTFLSKKYYSNLKKSKNEVKILNLYGLKFDKILHNGYNHNQFLEKDLQKSQKLISWADELVFFYPIWWGEMPSLLRSFFERTFIPGFAFKYEKSEKKKLLKGKKAKIFATAGGPKWYYHSIGFIDQKRTLGRILNFCGIKLKKIKLYGGVRKNIPKSYLEKMIQFLESF